MSRRIGIAARAAAGARARVSASTRGLWVEVDPGFFVGNDRRQFLGSITRTTTGAFSAFGPHSEFVGSFGDLDAAKAAVVAIADGPTVSAEPQLH